MRKWMITLVSGLVLCLLAACGAGEVEQDAPVEPEQETACVSTFRVVSGAESGQLLLADSEGAGIYMLSVNDLPIAPELRDGQLMRVWYEVVLESYPMQLGGVSDVQIVEGVFDDRCTLYLTVLEDLWNKDAGLNGGVECIGVDLSQTSLTPAEQAAVAWSFAGKHGAQCVQGSMEELIDQGWITATPLSTSGSGVDLEEPKHYFYAWENGCHFSITEQPMEGEYSLVPVTFDAQKWRSSLGAYFFSDCTAVQSALGEWSDNSVGTEMIA